jgi:hypothetical protein
MRSRPPRHGGPGRELDASRDPAAGRRRYGTSTIPACAEAGRVPAGAVGARTARPRRIVTRTQPAHSLGHVPAVRDEKLEPASARVHADNGQPAHDLPGRADDDHDAEPHPYGEPCARQRAGRQQHELGVVAGLGAARDTGRDRDGRARAGASVSRAGRTLSHETAGASTRGRPRGRGAKPPRRRRRRQAGSPSSSRRPPRAGAADAQMRRRGDQRHGCPGRPRGGGGGQERDSQDKHRCQAPAVIGLRCLAPIPFHGPHRPISV